MKIFVTMGKGEVRDSFFTPKAIQRLRQLGDVEFNDTDSFGCEKELLKEKIRDVDVLFTGWSAPRIDQEILDCADHLKIHAHTGGSVASYTSKEEYEKGIVVLSGNDLYARSVAEGCLTYVLTALRRTYDYMSVMKNGGWRPDPDYTCGLHDKKIGLVGYGPVARYFADVLQPFPVHLYVYSRHITDEELARIGAVRATKEEIFSECDIISLHSALNDANTGMITEQLIQSIPDGALFMNTARAGLVDNPALVRELQKERFQAVLDVYDEEPLPADSVLRQLPNVVLFPHIAGPTFDMREQVVLSLADDVENVLHHRKPSLYIPYDYAVRMTTR